MKPVITGYRLEQAIAEGARCKVYAAAQLSLGRQVALKVLKPELQNRPEEVARFKLQAHATENIRHENIAQTFAAGEADGCHYVARELIEGGNLARLLKWRHRLPLDRALQIIGAAVDALEAAWRQERLLHANLKPENILIDKSGLVRLCDFSGVSEQSAPALLRALSASSWGSPNYLPPEHSEGGRLDFRSDIFSLGALLYRMLCGREPFFNNSVSDLTDPQTERTATNPLNIDRRLSSAATVLIQKMMIREASGRYSSWEELRLDIASVQARRIPERGELKFHASAVADYAPRALLIARRRALALRIKFALIYAAIAAFALLNIYLLLELYR
jgi:eukaryotic-like serine/threonine-protein kinase